MESPRRGRVRGLVRRVLSVLLIVAASGCVGKVGPSTSATAAAYEHAVLAIDRSFNDGLRQSLKSGRTDADAAPLATAAANQLRRLNPPLQYKKGQMLLMDLYTLSARLLSESDDNQRARLAQQLLDLRQQVDANLPFLTADLLELPNPFGS